MSGTLPVSLDLFRTDFPAFADSGAWEDATVSQYLTLAATVLPYNRWRDYWTLGIELWTAHNLVLDEQANRAASKGVLPGTVAGIASSKSVGSVSVSYDSASGVEKDAGYWNMTTYGRRFIRLARMVGMGGVQLYQ